MRSLFASMPVLVALMTAASRLGHADTPAAAIPAEPVNAPWWFDRHTAFLEEGRTQSHSIQLLFLGDSITDGWHGTGLPVWNERMAPLHAANFGIGGDRVEHVLWRVRNGELDGLAPKTVVLLIGTNDLPAFSPEEINATHAVLLAELRQRLPAARILLLAVFPRVDEWSMSFRDKIGPVNLGLARIANQEPGMITFLDIGSRFQSADGGVSPDVMFDGLHLTEKGYRIWADALAPLLR